MSTLWPMFRAKHSYNRSQHVKIIYDPSLWFNTDVVIDPSLTPTWTSWVHYLIYFIIGFVVIGFIYFLCCGYFSGVCLFLLSTRDFDVLVL